VVLLLLVLLFAGSVSFDTAYRAGLAALNRNDLRTARTQLEAAAKLHPEQATVWLALAQTYLKGGQQNEAKSAAIKAGKLAPANAVILRGLWLFYAEAGDPRTAGGFAERYAGTMQNEPNALASAAELYLRASEPKLAISTAKRSLAGEDRAELHALLAKAYAADGQSASSLAELRAAANLHPYDESVYFEVAQEFLRTQRFEDAIAALDLSAKVFDKSAQLTLARGVALYGLRRFREAIDAFLKTIAIAPEVEQPYIFLGRMVDSAESRLPGITHAFAAYAESQPGNALSSFVYAKALAAGSGDPAQIESLLRRSIALNGRTWESHFELGLALERRRALDEAAKELERSIELKPDAAAPHYRLARIYDRLGRSADAERQRTIHAKLTSHPSDGIEPVK
jgi:tetratricopeptide (TPR) repeat protein